MNSLIKSIFTNFTVDGVLIPVKFLIYHGHGEPYITYNLDGYERSLSADDELENYAENYSFSIYSKGNYLNIEQQMKTLLKNNGFIWLANRSSGDLYDPDIGYYFKTLFFSYLKGE